MNATTTRTSRLAGLAVVAATAASAIILAPSAAFAGTGGQELVIYSNNADSVQVCGWNQYGNNVCHVWKTPNYQTNLTGWWWHSTTTVTFCRTLTATSCYATETLSIPKNMATDYYPVYG